jgi:competence ComEA-like helix-hairpin-helix protein
MDNTESDLRNHAGPYGFTRREVGIIAAVIGVCLAVIGYSEWRDRQQPAPVWAVEDIQIDGTDSPPRLDSASTTAQDDPKRARAFGNSERINLNSADVRELARLPGIGTELARRIIDERSANGSFVNLTDLQRVNGIGPRKAAMLSGWVKFADEPKPETGEDSSETE